MNYRFRIANDINTGVWIMADAEANDIESARQIIKDRFRLPDWHSIPFVEQPNQK